ncbi:ATP-binding cassette domain-containing protein [Viridibacillus sp. NPDC093762]|uniref:ATP-binding cassette domain-containing protein n=1 Tax=Viridibacillus sp. NPDC093762 TaxID=3390720 RepID=UPI003D060477
MNLILENISKSFKDQSVLKSVNLKLSSSGCHLLLGENGSGKTTLTKIIDGELSVDSGQVYLTNDEKNKVDCAIQYQDFNAFPYLKIKEVIELFKKMTKQYDFNQNLYDLLELKKFEKTLIKNSSGGMKKAVSIFISVLLNKPIIILDEPFADLDLKKKKDLRVFLADYSKEKEKIILIISHEVNEFEELFDTISILDEGIIKESDYSEKLLNKYKITSRFSIEDLFYAVTGKRLVLYK